MNYLSIKECKPFFEYFLPNMLNVGLMEPLREFADKNNNLLGDAIRSLYNTLRSGKSLQDSICEMTPKFPRCIEELMKLSFKQSNLDSVISEMLIVYEENDLEENLLKKMSLLVDRYQHSPNSKFISQDCFERELNKVIRRAKIEGANEVIFEQEEELFLHQKFVSVKLVHIIEPSHSKTYRTLRKKMRQSAKDNAPIVISSGKLFVCEIGNNKFKLTGSDIVLTLAFK
jgi:hypothetical protein